ncbi:MAG: hypothetical protein C0394_02435 [Syntrophus sp. (in: bacteria)]|nr:hypothetical protein [Syntrophus sp. (in: bacteria)]
MAVLKESGIPLGRMMLVPKSGDFTREDLIIEANGTYQLLEKPDCFVIKNTECCRSILVKVMTKDA